MNRKSIIQAIISENAKSYKFGQSYSLTPSRKQIANAISNYANGCQPEDVIAIFDETLMGNGKKGLIFTVEGVYVAEADYHVAKTERTPQPIRYDEVQSIEISEYFAYLHYPDGGITKAYLGCKTESFAGLFTLIQEALAPEVSLEADEEEFVPEETESDGDIIVYLLDENGDKIPFEFLDLISDRGKDYVVLLPLEDEEDDAVVILQIDDSVEDSDTESYIAVESDEILNRIFEIFKERNAEQFTFTDQNRDVESERPVPFEGSQPYIFISYSHKDADTVLTIVRQLQHDGFRVWYDEGIDPGTEWDENIAVHLEHSSCFIAFMSENYVNSNNCRDEVNYARDLELKRLLIYLDDVKLTGGMAMRLNRLQALFYHKYQLKPLFYKRLYESGIMSESGVRAE